MLFPSFLGFALFPFLGFVGTDSPFLSFESCPDCCSARSSKVKNITLNPTTNQMAKVRQFKVNFLKFSSFYPQPFIGYTNCRLLLRARRENRGARLTDTERSTKNN